MLSPACAAHSMVPPFLLMWYNFIGRGGSLRAVCTVLFFVSSACGILAIVLLWLVYPRDVRAPRPSQLPQPALICACLSAL